MGEAALCAELVDGNVAWMLTTTGVGITSAPRSAARTGVRTCSSRWTQRRYAIQTTFDW